VIAAVSQAQGVRRAGAVLALALALVLAVVPVALAVPKGIFAKFAQCPTAESGVALCQYLEVSGGSFSIGKASIPIERGLVIQGGAVPTGGSNYNEYFLVPATNGQTISANELQLPGGLQALLGCSPEGCRSPSGGKAPNAVYASLEPATSPTNREIFNLEAAVEETGHAVTLPVQMQLRNALLGSACFIGSVAQPVELRLTDGTTSPPPPAKPISGTLGALGSELEDGYEAISAVGVTLVDNAFSMPLARGCGGSSAFLVDPAIDRKLGLESSAGRNTAILKGTLHMAEVEDVRASEAFPSK
jgi:hypothetical protein